MFGWFKKKPTQEELAQQLVDLLTATIKEYDEQVAKPMAATITKNFIDGLQMVGTEDEAYGRYDGLVEALDRDYKPRMMAGCVQSLGTLYNAVHENPDKMAGTGLDQMIDDAVTMNMVYIIQEAGFARDKFVTDLRRKVTG